MHTIEAIVREKRQRFPVQATACYFNSSSFVKEAMFDQATLPSARSTFCGVMGWE